MNTAWAEPVKNWLNTGLGFFYPETCQLCQEQPSSVAEGLICAECQKQVRPLQKPFCQRCGLPFAGEISTEFQCANCGDVELHFSSARAATNISSCIRRVRAACCWNWWKRLNRERCIDGNRDIAGD